MSIEKKATAILSDVKLLDEPNDGLVKLAASKLSVDAYSHAKKVIDAEIKKHPTALFFRAKAIAADETNANGDFFSSEELIKATSSFIGVPFYTNHENTDITKAKGKIVFSEWDDKEKAIYVIGFVDREAYPQLCRGVEQEYMKGVSMGCVVQSSECSICGNEAETVEDYCPHIKFRKGRTFTGTAKNVKTGEIKQFKNAPVYEKNHGVRFIELSGVGDPACKSCNITGVFNNDEFLSKAASCSCNSSLGHGTSFMSKVASVENSLLMYQDTDLYKQASQQELQQIDQVLQTLEQISVNLIKNRKRVEVEFASDLVKILSELQEFADELTGAGYGQLQEGSGMADAVDQSLSGLDADLSGANPLPGPAEGVPNASGVTGMPTASLNDNLGIIPTSENLQEHSSDVGTVSGSPSQSRIKMPTAPKKPMASSVDRLEKVAEFVETIKTALKTIQIEQYDGGESEMNRRIPTVAAREKAKIKQVLSENTKETSTVSENLIKGNNAQSGGIHMESITQMASRTNAPGVLPEKQLDSNRAGVEQDATQQVQLDGKRKNAEPQTLPENQMNGVRKNDCPCVTNEKQLADMRKNESLDATQQVQLEDNRVGNEPETLTEKQLCNKPASLWERSAMNRKNVKTAQQHTQAVIRILAESAVRCSATPQQVRSAASSLVDGTKVRSAVLDLITSDSSFGVEQESASGIVARARYWGSKGITIASATAEDIASDIVAGLRMLVASDEFINPNDIVDVLDVVGTEDDALTALSNEIDNVMEEPQQEIAASNSRKQQIKMAILEQSKVEHVDKPEEFQPAALPGTKAKEEEDKHLDIAASRRRSMERVAMRKAINEKIPSHIIEASTEEIGTTLDELKNNSTVAKQKIIAFVNKISEMKNLVIDKPVATKNGKQVVVASKVSSLRVANITNVTVGPDGTVQIAIQSEDGEDTTDVSIPMEDQGNDVAGNPPEGDATGEGLDNLIGGDVNTPSSIGGVPPEAPAPNAPLPATASNKKTIVTAQFGGGGGGMPGGGALGGQQDPGSSVPQGMPAMDAGGGLQNFTQDEDSQEDDYAPGVGEQMMPGSICPFCHGSDTTTGKKELPAGAFECNNCGAIYEVHVNIEVLNPEGMSFEAGDNKDGVTEPKLPEMPVAASINLTKGNLQKIASCEQKYGHVCPACGMTECKTQEKLASGNVVYVCPSCQTKTTKEILVANDKSAFLQVNWNLNPKKVFTAGCKTCKDAAKEYAALISVTKMMQRAAQANAKPETAFPDANCAEYISRRFGSNAVATFGPCKGKSLVECVCKQLKSFGLRKRLDVEKLASVYTQPDPMDKCLELQKGKGYKEKQASTICNAMKAKYAKESDDNEWLSAFAGDSRFTTEELRIMKQKSNAMLNRNAQTEGDEIQEPNFDLDLSAPLDDVTPVGDETEVENDGDQMVTIEIPESLAKDLSDQIETKVSENEMPEEVTLDVPEEINEETPIEVSDEIPEEVTLDVTEPKDDMAVQAVTKLRIKIAGKPEKVEDISSGVTGKLQSGNGTIGKEQKFTAQKPVVPSRGDGSKIKGEKETINGATLPDIPVDSSTMGDEANTLQGTPNINNEFRGRVVAKSDGVIKEAGKPKIVEDISSGVNGKTKSGKGNIGNEEAFKADKPSIPEKGSSSKIGGEKHTIPDAELPDIPTDNDLIGGEKETMKGTPGINNDIRGRVLVNAKRDEQLAKIAAARHKKACLVAAKLMGMGRIAESNYDTVVECLAKIETDKIESFAEMMYSNVKTASASVATPKLATPIIQEASAYNPKLPKSMNEELNGIFTIGSAELHKQVAEDDRKNEENQ